MDDHWRAERLGEAQVFLVIRIGSYLRQVAAVVRAGVNVDAVGAATDDFLHEEMGDAAGQGALG